MLSGFWYRFIYVLARVGLFFYHPVFRVVGREHIPAEGRYLICCNHSGLADPVWVVLAMKLDHIPRVMAKKEAIKVPVFGRFLEWLGAFGVDRDGADVNAIKTGLRCLREGQQLLIFPEGTRMKPGKTVQPKRGVILLAHRTDSPILPVYLTAKRRPFSSMTCVFGEPYRLDFDGKKPTDAQMDQAVQDLMKKIYQMGETV